MKKCTIIITLFSVFLLSISCSTMQYTINKNNKFTQKQLCDLVQKNGNAFYLSSGNATFSTVWTYNASEIEMYRLAKGKVYKKETFQEKEFIQYDFQSIQDIGNELYKKCALVIDGDGFGFRITVDGKMYREDYPIDIDCLKKEIYQSAFLNKIVNDIKTHKMWELAYQ